MKVLERFVFSLNDLYGRVMSGAILLVAAYFLVSDRPDYVGLNTAIGTFYKGSNTIFTIVFLLVSFLVGHIPHALSFKCFSWFRRPPSIEDVLSTGNFDPTLDKRMATLFRSHFSKAAVEEGSWCVLAFCKDHLQCFYPELHRSLKQAEARINFQGGIIFPMLLAAVVLAVKGALLWCFITAVVAGWFVYKFVDSVRGEAESIIRLYYHAVGSDKQSESSEADHEAVQS